MNETIEMKVRLDIKEAQRLLGDFRQDAIKAGGGVDTLQKSFGLLKERMEKQAGAFAALSMAMGSGDNAIGKATAGAGQLAAAYGAGGPLALALLAGSAAISALTKHWDDLIKKQDELRDKQYATVGALAKTNQAAQQMRQQSAAQMQAARLGFDPSTESITGIRERYAPQLAAAQAEADSTYSQYRDGKDKSGEDYSRMFAEYKQASDTVKEIEAAMGNDIEAYKARRAERIKTEKDAANKEAEAFAKTAAALAESNMRAEEDALRNVQKVESDQRLSALKRDHEALIAAAKERHSEEERLAKESAKEQERIAKESAAEQLRIQEQQVQQLSGLGGSLAAAMGSFAAEAALGQEAAFANFVKAASQAAGGFVMLEGGKSLAKGIAYAVDPLTAPLAAGPIAAGLLLTAAGAAIQTAGPLAVSQLTGAAGGGASSGRAGGVGSGGAVADPGVGIVGARSGGGGRRGESSGATVINITYAGNSGPSADDGARAVVSGLRRANRRGLTPVRVL